MLPSAFPEANAILGPPRGLTEDEVGSLYVRRVPGSVTSCWRPTAEELEEIQRTGRIWLVVMGETQPPVALTGHSPFGDPL